jgi:uncharacterized membrane protein HdeD (DUF308 family)
MAAAAVTDRLFSGWVDNWWIFAVRGALAIIFAILAMINPVAALLAIVLLFGAWALIDGITALALSLSSYRRSWQLVIVGLIGIAAGAVTFVWPSLTAVGLYAAVAGWSIIRGVLEIALAIELRKVIEGEFWLIFGGIVSILFGVLMIALPLAGLLVLAWLIAVYALVFGISMIALSARLHRLKTPTAMRPPLAAAPPAAT